MHKVLFDTNVLLDLFGANTNSSDCATAKELATALWCAGDGFLVTPTQLKDFRYLYATYLKRSLRAEKGDLSRRDVQAIDVAAQASLENLLELATVTSEGIADCRMAKLMCKQHNDYEDNLIAAVALRIGADFIVTRDKAFLNHCPVACLSPNDMLAYLRNVLQE